ncbi:MAG: polyamine aminopropyltransferase [Bradymonadia bacterium]
MSLWYTETYNDRTRTGVRVTETLFSAESAFQTIEVFDTPQYGKVLVLDGLFQTSEGEEHLYHEMLVHPAMTVAPKIERVLVIGGGDGGTAREVLRHPGVQQVVMVEIDPMVVEACKTHMPALNDGAFEDPRMTLRIEDAVKYVAELAPGTFDVAILDGSDPVGPSEGLFNRSFHESVKRALTDEGVFAVQSESPIIFKDVFVELVQLMAEVFPQAKPCFGNVPLYGGAGWSWTVASMNPELDLLAPRADRLEHIVARCKHYNADIHRGAFAMPNNIRAMLETPAQQEG